MTIEPIGFLLALAAIYAMTGPMSAGILLLCLCTLFGAAAAMILPALGGANIQPFHFVLVFLAASVVLRPKTLAAAASSLNYPGPGFWFALFVFYCVLTAVFLPRIFAGATLVYSMARNDDTHVITSALLSPTVSNLTQSAYMLGNLWCFAIIAAFGRGGGMPIIARALIITSGACIIFALADVATYLTGTANLLSLIRNANYRILDDGDIAGFKRIVGSFAEAGAFGYVALALFTFVLMLYLEGFSARFLGLITIALAAALVLCTSTTAYAASAITAVLVLLFCLSRFVREKATHRHIVYLAICLFAIPLVVMVLMLIPSAWESVHDLVKATVTTKLETHSAEERLRWNAQALDSFLETSGMGAGLGSIRASSFVVALFANVGAPGAAIFVIFAMSLVRSVLRRDDDTHRARTVGFAALFASIAQISAASISAGSVDLGPLFAITAGLATAYALGPLHMEVDVGEGVAQIAFAPEMETSSVELNGGGPAAADWSPDFHFGRGRRDNRHD
ncbi:O-antigen ligase family protein [Rhizobium sp. BK251]|uniref:O-antigen ligase family protein n=1 Tax=Rhizobium sp. BK251 TaxID=2512125 RepID=UPI0010434DE9|nr:O-antigen ligase family protein [Rhizobium sp. BK251]TCL66377.1 O-antigen ligase-like membrane protein [Rhizobium sp. BK251]